MRMNRAEDSLGCLWVVGTGYAVKAAGAGGSHMLYQRCFGNSEAHVSSES